MVFTRTTYSEFFLKKQKKMPRRQCIDAGLETKEGKDLHLPFLSLFLTTPSEISEKLYEAVKILDIDSNPFHLKLMNDYSFIHI